MVTRTAKELETTRIGTETKIGIEMTKIDTEMIRKGATKIKTAIGRGETRIKIGIGKTEKRTEKEKRIRIGNEIRRRIETEKTIKTETVIGKGGTEIGTGKTTEIGIETRAEIGGTERKTETCRILNPKV